MLKFNRRVVSRVAASAAVLAAMATSIAALAQSPAGPIKVGGLSFLTGKFGSYGQDIGKGMRLAIKQINDGGGLLGGAKLELDLQDTVSDSAQAVSLLRRFAGSADVVGVVGPVGTPDFLAILPLSGQLGVPIISLGSQKEMASTEFSDWIVRVNLPVTPALITAVLAQTKKGRKLETVALIRDRANDSGQAEAKAVRQAIEAGAGVKLVSDEAYAAGDKDFGAVLDKMLREKPDAIWIAGVTNEVSLLLQQARARGFKGSFLGGAGMNDPKIAQLAKEAAAGIVTFLPVNFESNAPQVKKFIAGYREAHGQGPIPVYAVYGYDGVMILANAISTAKSTDRKVVMQALGNTKGFVTVSGSYTYAGKGDNVAPFPFLVEMTAEGNFKPLN